MYVLSISSVSEVLMVQFEFSNSHTELTFDSRSYISFSSFLFFVRACTDACTPTTPPSPPTPSFSFTLFTAELGCSHRGNTIAARTIRSIDRSSVPPGTKVQARIDRSCQARARYQTHIIRTNQLFERAVHPTMPLVSDCLSRDYPIYVCACVCTNVLAEIFIRSRIPREIQRKNNTERRETD